MILWYDSTFFVVSVLLSVEVMAVVVAGPYDIVIESRLSSFVAVIVIIVDVVLVVMVVTHEN
jgi:hypothetical protein